VHAPPTADEWKAIEPLVDAVLDVPAAQRAELILKLSAGDRARERELESLVAECERRYALLDEPAATRFAAVIEAEPSLVPELLAGRYRVVREAGRGGMAIVYLARDLKHGRDVAIKVVRRELAATIGRRRFLHEIEIAAQLRHPHIVPLYDSGEVPLPVESSGTGESLLYYVMPYETGHSLRDRLDRDGCLPAADVVLLLRDLCEALAHAHRRGVVHRDIKPDNVLLSDGHALITDFGVARAVTEATTDVSGGVASTALGTPNYMAPEQLAANGNVDHRADIWAIGVLAYELLLGRPQLAGDDAAARRQQLRSELASRMARGRPDVPLALGQLIARCLAERPEDRWQSADEVLSQLARVGAAMESTVSGRWSSARALFVGVAIIAAASLLAVGRVRFPGRSASPTLAIGLATQLTSETGLEVQPSISPDSRWVAYAAGNSLKTRIAVRPIAGGRPRWLTADTTRTQWLPSWSPDGKRVLFLSSGGVFSAPARGGSIREEVASRPGEVIRSAAWSANGRAIAYVRGDSLLVRAVGSGATRLLGTGADLHSCRWSPNDSWLACVSGNSFYVTIGAVSGEGPMFGNLAPSRVVLVPATGGRPLNVTDGAASLNQSPVWSRDGRTLYYVSDEQGPRDIFAVDLESLGRSPNRAPRSTPVRITTGLGAQSIDLSTDGRHLVYAAYSSTANVWAIAIPTRTTAAVSAHAGSSQQVTSGNQTIEGVRISPDGRWLLYDSNLGGNSDIYRTPIEPPGGEPDRLTRGPGDKFRGVLSPNGRELAYHSFQTGSRNIFLSTVGADSVRQLTRSANQFAMPNWSPDGNALAFFDMTATRIMVMRRDSTGRWRAPRFTGGRGWRAEWSPDGRTIAFVSPVDGRIGLVPADSGAVRDLYVPWRGDPLAELALFAPDGRALYFKSHDSRGQASFWILPVTGGRPRRLIQFDDPSWSSNRFDFASDGKRFYFTVENRQSDLWVAALGGR